MLEKAIANVVKEYDEEVTSIVVHDDNTVVIQYDDGDTFSGEIRVKDSDIILDFGGAFTMTIHLTLEL